MKLSRHTDRPITHQCVRTYVSTCVCAHVRAAYSCCCHNYVAHIYITVSFRSPSHILLLFMLQHAACVTLLNTRPLFLEHFLWTKRHHNVYHCAAPCKSEVGPRANDVTLEAPPAPAPQPRQPPDRCARKTRHTPRLSKIPWHVTEAAVFRQVRLHSTSRGKLLTNLPRQDSIRDTYGRSPLSRRIKKL
jgi:hypothetical protein